MNQAEENLGKNENIVAVSHKQWGTFDGKHVCLFKLKNSRGAFVELTNYGATITSLVVPDKQGALGNVVLGFPSLEGYVNDRCYLGSTIGRYANRIKDAQFPLDEVMYYLDKNDNVNSNHGGASGFHGRVFDFVINSDSVSFTLVSKDGEGGYPGNVQLNVTYTWNDDNVLAIRYNAVSDKRTVLNITNHAYFNLAAEHGDILGHELTIYAREMLATRTDYIPTGSIVPVRDKLFHGHVIRDNIKMTGNTIEGFNTYYVLERHQENQINHAC
ncbi:MAG: galactose-1-epimerase, partial [Marivirga sp.]|nr:galactose-1-epimerase [Marivirga sp.]